MKIYPYVCLTTPGMTVLAKVSAGIPDNWEKLALQTVLSTKQWTWLVSSFIFIIQSRNC